MGARVIKTSELEKVWRVISGVGVIECPEPECRRYVQVTWGNTVAPHEMLPQHVRCPNSGVSVVDDAA